MSPPEHFAPIAEWLVEALRPVHLRKDPHVTTDLDTQPPPGAPGATRSFHVGRSWTAHTLEDECPCPKAPCGLVDTATPFDQRCPQHDPSKTIRQGHSADQCPALDTGEGGQP